MNRFFRLFLATSLATFALACGDDDGGDGSGCCVALPGQDQAACDAVESFGEDRCNMLNSGATCAWASTPACASTPDAGTDGGPGGSDVPVVDAPGQDVPTADVPTVDAPVADAPIVDAPMSDAPMSDVPGVDAAPPTGCCVAQAGTAQSVCDAVEGFGMDRCNMLGGGGSCMWSMTPECSPVTPDACCVALPGQSQDACDLVEPFGMERCNMVSGGTSCAWSDVPECNGPDVGCCVALDPADQAQCTRAEPFGEARCNMLNGGGTCAWSGDASCASPACCTAINPRFELICRNLENDSSGCQTARECTWNAGPMCPDTPTNCCTGVNPADDRRCSLFNTSMARCSALAACMWDLTCR